MEKFDTVDAYIASFPNDVQKALQTLRSLIHETVPGVSEDMSYKMPSFKLNKKPLVYFAAWKSHISLYPTPSGMVAFEKELEPYKSGKGTAKFNLKKPIPYDLIKKIIHYRKEEVQK